MDEVERAAAATLENFKAYSTAKLAEVEALLDNALVTAIESVQLDLQAANDRADVVSICLC